MERTRRSVIASGAAIGVGGVAGCLGGGSGGGGGDGGDESGNELDTGSYDCDLTAPEDPNLDYRPTLGDPDADVVVRVFEDFTCPHCATYSLEEFPTIREEYIEPGDIRYEHWDFPIPVNETWAVPVASAARGVGDREGDEAFFAFSSAVFESVEEYSGEAIGDAAEEADADPCEAMADAQDSTYADAAESDKSEGESMDIDGTPTIFVDGEAVDGYEADAIAEAIDDAL